jgi:ParB family chromosome partitioning protein
VRKIQDGHKDPKKEKSPKVDEKKQKALKQISSYFGAKVELKVNKKGNGKLIVPFSSDEDFQRIKKLIQGYS